MPTSDFNGSATLDVATLPPGQLARRRRIIDVATELLQEEEYEHIQMRIVAERAGVALGTLYRYFTSKDHLYAAVMLDWAAFDSTPPHRPDETSLDRVKRRVRRAIRAVELHPNFFKLEVVLRATTDPIAREIYEENSRRFMDALIRDMEPIPLAEAKDRAPIIVGTLALVQAGLLSQQMDVATANRILRKCVDLVVGPDSGRAT